MCAGGRAGDALLVAGRLALLGARHVVLAVESPPSDALVRLGQRALRRHRGARLEALYVRAWNAATAAAVVAAATNAAPLHVAVVIAKVACRTLSEIMS